MVQSFPDEVVAVGAMVAQRMQIQALFLAASGTCWSRCALNCTRVHQHGSACVG
jgi:hypothetical protein